MYDVFVRSWWRCNKNWPNGLEPHAGRKTYIARKISEREARSIAEVYNKNHDPGRLGRKAEYEHA